MLGKSLLILALSTSGAFAGLTNSFGSSTSTNLRCTTKNGAVSHNAVPTSTKTSRLAPQVVVIFTTSHPTVTTTPKAVTSTSTFVVPSTTTITAPVQTDTVTSTSTITATTTSTSVVFTTSTELDSTTTTTTSTSTIPAPAGFTPITGSSGDSNYTAQSKRSARSLHEDFLDVNRARSVLEKRSSRGGSLCRGKSQYPQAVSCIDYTQVHYTEEIILVGTTITSAAATPTLTATSTSTAISSSTIYPSVSVTLTTTSTITSTATSLTTSTLSTTTTTTLLASATATFYAACAAPNILGPQIQNGNYLDHYQFNDLSDTFTDTNGPFNTAYDCCAMCFQTPGCLTAALAGPGGEYCELAINTARTCSTQYIAGSFTSEASTDGDTPVFFMNGPCGQLTDGGSG